MGLTVFVVASGITYIQQFLFLFSALSERECELWIKGLRYLVKDTLNAPYPLLLESWLRREFYAMESREL